MSLVTCSSREISNLAFSAKKKTYRFVKFLAWMMHNFNMILKSKRAVYNRQRVLQDRRSPLQNKFLCRNFESRVWVCHFFCWKEKTFYSFFSANIEKISEKVITRPEKSIEFLVKLSKPKFSKANVQVRRLSSFQG